jgi:hypothetical protein
MSRKKKRPGLGRRGKNKKGEREERGMEEPGPEREQGLSSVLVEGQPGPGGN